MGWPSGPMYWTSRIVLVVVVTWNNHSQLRRRFSWRTQDWSLLSYIVSDMLLLSPGHHGPLHWQLAGVGGHTVAVAVGVDLVLLARTVPRPAMERIIPCECWHRLSVKDHNCWDIYASVKQDHQLNGCYIEDSYDYMNGYARLGFLLHFTMKGSEW